MSELGKANETSMGLPRSGGSSCTTVVTSPNITTTTAPNNSHANNNNNNSEDSKSRVCSSACRRSSTAEPRGEKRPWDGLATEEDTAEGEPPSKLLCTSPPHALCAEDVPQQPHQPLDKQYRGTNKMNSTSSSSSNNNNTSNNNNESIMATEDLLPIEATCGVSDESDTDAEMEDERDFLDEEDKDSGFIDSHSIDNSSDDDMDVRLTSVVAIPSTNNNNTAMNSNSCSDLSEVQINCTLEPSSIEPVVSKTSPRTSDNSPPCTLQSSADSAVVPSSTVSNIATILPSCSSAFCAYSPLSSNFVPSTLSIGDRSSGPSSYCQSSSPSCESIPSSQVCTSAVEQCISESAPQNSLISNSSNSISFYMSEVFSTSIALSIDVRSSSTLPPLNGPTCSSIGDSSPDNLVQSMSSVSTSPAQTLPSILSREFATPSDSSNVTVASANAETIVTSAYSGTVSSPVYDPHLYQPYGTEVTPRASPSLPNGSWSCNFYDGNQPTMTNKYMEIQTSKISGGCPSPPPSSSQAIQCDANGKSYMDLGSSSPFTQTYSTDCGNYTTSPSNNFTGVLYNNQTCTNSNNYNQQQQQSPQQSSNNQFYRPGYSQFSGFPSSDGCPGSYDGDSSVGCTYGYPPSYAPTRPIKMMPPRCGSPFCDPSRPSSLRSACYQQQRLAVLNMSMCKLNRFSRCADPRLHKSVLICNTLRLIEKEFESEGTSMNTILSQQHMMQAGLPPHCPPPPPTPPPLAMSGGSSEGPLPSMHPPIISSPVPGPCTPPPVLPPPIMPPYTGGSNPYRGPHYPDGAYEDLRAYSSVLECEPLPGAPESHSSLHLRSNTASPSPVLEQTSVTVLGNVGSVLSCNSNNSNSINTGSISNNNYTGSNDATCSSNNNPSNVEDRAESGINWCSVLSLPSQSELDSLNSADFCEWGSEANMEIEYSNSSSCTTSSTRSCSSINNSNSCSSSGISSSSSTSTNLNPASPYKNDLPSLSADDVLKSFPDQPRRIEPAEELDNLIDVLVES